jgi:hypothetical protein
MKTPKEQWQDLQEQNLQLLKSQQEAYLAGIKAWRAQLAATDSSNSTNPQVPTFSTFTGNLPGAGQNPVQPPSFPAFPSSDEIVEINRTYMEKITQQQQEFLRQLNALNSEQA